MTAVRSRFARRPAAQLLRSLLAAVVDPRQPQLSNSKLIVPPLGGASGERTTPRSRLLPSSPARPLLLLLFAVIVTLPSPLPTQRYSTAVFGRSFGFASPSTSLPFFSLPLI